ncbi:hypothetical protein FPHOBKDP_00033 [Listeria phage LPJP1]|nr:hypothetical protein FPHOBKDP_00033 [Listeria phage LPJP1]
MKDDSLLETRLTYKDLKNIKIIVGYLSSHDEMNIIEGININTGKPAIFVKPISREEIIRIHESISILEEEKQNPSIRYKLTTIPKLVSELQHNPLVCTVKISE